MDGQRQYPTEPERWYGEHPDDEAGRVPGQRPGDRYPDESGAYTYGTPAPYAEPGYSDPAYAAADAAYAPADAAYAPADAGYADQRYAEPGYDDAPAYPGGSDGSPRRVPVRRRVGKRPGVDAPGLDASMDEPGTAEEPQRYRAERLDRQALRRPTDAAEPSRAVEPQSPAGSGSTALQQPVSTPQTYPLQAPTQAMPTPPPAVYLSRRPGLATLLGAAAVIVELFLARVLITAEFAHIVITNGVLASVFAMAGVPLVAIGLYALAIGAASVSGSNPGRAWLRTPLAYLPVGLILIFAAALAT